MTGNHAYGPTREPGDDDADARDAAAKAGAACYWLADNMAALLDRRRSEWKPGDAPLVEHLSTLLTEAHEITKRLGE